ARWVGPRTRVAVLQNGVEHRERLAPWVDAANLVPVVVACPADQTAPGRIVQRRTARLVVPDDAGGRAFAALYDGTEVRVETVADWTSAAWKKLCLNVTSGALAALAGVPLPEIRHPARGPLAHALALECARVARAEGADLPDADARAIAEAAASATRGGSPSTLTDRLRGRPLEADARNGAVVRIAAKHGIATPVNARAVELMRRVHAETATDWLPALAEALPQSAG
ncbi:MAG: ketopantoate reductase family protein, partial [Myxococcota bacterium]